MRVAQVGLCNVQPRCCCSETTMPDPFGGSWRGRVCSVVIYLSLICCRRINTNPRGLMAEFVVLAAATLLLLCWKTLEFK